MAEASEGSGKGLYFIVGGMVVVLGFLAFMYFGGRTGGPFHMGGGSSTTERTVTTGQTPLGSATVTTTTTTEKKP